MQLTSDCLATKRPPSSLPSVFALNRHWHLGCFRCASCSKSLHNIQYHSLPSQAVADLPATSANLNGNAESRTASRASVRASTPQSTIDSKTAGTKMETNKSAAGSGEVALCESCYQTRLAVRCAHCSREIEGRVLQAGESLHFHPSCARCCKCGERFAHAQEMFVQGKAIWHAHCEGIVPDPPLSRVS